MVLLAGFAYQQQAAGIRAYLAVRRALWCEMIIAGDEVNITKPRFALYDERLFVGRGGIWVRRNSGDFGIL